MKVTELKNKIVFPLNKAVGDVVREQTKFELSSSECFVSYLQNENSGMPSYR